MRMWAPIDVRLPIPGLAMQFMHIMYDERMSGLVGKPPNSINELILGQRSRSIDTVRPPRDHGAPQSVAIFDSEAFLYDRGFAMNFIGRR